MNKLGKDGFVIKSNLKHNNKYNYDNVLYTLLADSKNYEYEILQF